MSSLFQKCLALTGSFETSHKAPECFGVVTGNFDDQGLSFGALQFNVGQGTLRPIILGLLDHRALVEPILKENVFVFIDLASTKPEVAMAAALNMQTSKGVITPTYKEMFKKLGALQVCIDLQMAEVNGYWSRAQKMLKTYFLTSERAIALFFDIAVQNGSIRLKCANKILNRFNDLVDENDNEVAKMKIIAEERALASAYYTDVFARKMCIATGQGVVHGIKYNLDELGLTLAEADLG
jgi:hypothetical protein